jgi:hypothetical protein
MTSYERDVVEEGNSISYSCESLIDLVSMDSDEEREPLVEKLRNIETKVHIMTSIRQMSPRRLQHYRYLLSRLIIITPIPKDNKTKLAHAFLKWAYNLPLHNKCDELGAQLQERASVVQVVKEAYLRDVIR